MAGELVYNFEFKDRKSNNIVTNVTESNKGISYILFVHLFQFQCCIHTMYMPLKGTSHNTTMTTSFVRVCFSCSLGSLPPKFHGRTVAIYLNSKQT